MSGALQISFELCLTKEFGSGVHHTLALNKPTLKNKGGSMSNPLCRRNEDQGVLDQSCAKELVLFLLYRYEHVRNKGNYTNRSE